MSLAGARLDVLVGFAFVDRGRGLGRRLERFVTIGVKRSCREAKSPPATETGQGSELDATR